MNSGHYSVDIGPRFSYILTNQARSAKGVTGDGRLTERVRFLRARFVTTLSGGLGIVPSGTCRTARCSLHWCRRGSSRLDPVIPGSAARAEPRLKNLGECRGGAPKGGRAPLPTLPRKRGRRGKGPRPCSVRARQLMDAPAGAPPPFA